MNATFSKIEKLVEKAQGEGVTEADALSFVTAPKDELPAIFAGAAELTKSCFKNKVRLCSIINAKSGKCDQNCSFCAQSAHHDASIDQYEFLDTGTILKAAESAKEFGASEFSIVTSGKSLKGKELEKAIKAIKGISKIDGLAPCASIGVLSYEVLVRLKEAGVQRLHHNLETARSHYGEICTTRDFDDNVKTITDAQKVGIKTCCGCLFGIGETPLQRVELAFEISRIGAGSVPVNFLHPIPGTPLADKKDLRPLDCLRIISMLRFVMPKAQIILCGGRQENLGQLQSMAFLAGASGMMVGNYLTTKGCNPKDDLQMLYDLGLEPAGRTR